MSEQLSDKEAQQLFNQIGKALGSGDTEKLDSLFTEPVPSEDVEEKKEESPTEVPEADDNEVDDTPEVKEEEDKSENPQEEQSADSTEDSKVATEPDELAKLKEKLDKVEKENHSLRSQAGRVPHVQRRLQELDKRLEELSKRAASPSSQTLEKIQPKLQARLKALKETDPELAELLEGSITDAISGVAEDAISREKETLTLLRDVDSTEQREHEINRLLDMYPNAPDVFKSDSWKSWKKEQTDAVRALAGSDTADDVAFAFEKYAKDMVAQYPELATKTEETKTTVKTPDPAAAAEAQRIEQDRQRKKSTQAVVGSPAAAAKTQVPDNPEELFKRYSESIRKEITGG